MEANREKTCGMLCRSTPEYEGLILEYIENIRNWKVFLISWYFDKTEGIDPLGPSAKRLSVSWEKAQDALGWNSRGKRLGSGSGTSWSSRPPCCQCCGLAIPACRPQGASTEETRLKKEKWKFNDSLA